MGVQITRQLGLPNPNYKGWVWSGVGIFKIRWPNRTPSSLSQLRHCPSSRDRWLPWLPSIMTAALTLNRDCRCPSSHSSAHIQLFICHRDCSLLRSSRSSAIVTVVCLPSWPLRSNRSSALRSNGDCRFICRCPASADSFVDFFYYFIFSFILVSPSQPNPTRIFG